MELVTLIFHFVVVAQLVSGQMTDTVDVNLPQYGLIRGSFTQDGPVFSRVNTFLGISYAKPPIGDLRFKAPELATAWAPNTHVATSYKPPCVQVRDGGPMGSEDCLHLNIYVPGDITRRKDEPIPVMIYLHGGRFVSGSAQDYRGDKLIAGELDSSVVFVTLDYRLGIFGFMSSGNDVISGNMGLKDQAFAIKWVHDNIGHFGGDKTAITIIGQEAGGAAVKLHILSAMNVDTFHRAIVQSGLSMWRLPDKSYHAESFVEYASGLGCYGDSATLLQCLQTKSTASVLFAIDADKFIMPLIDGDFLSMNPEDILTSGNYSNVDLIVGFNSDDGTSWFDASDITTVNQFLAVGIPSGGRGLDTGFGYCVHVAVSELSIFYDQTFVYAREVERITNIPELLEMVHNQYISSDLDSRQNGRRLLDAVRDCAYVAHSLDMAQQMSRHGAHVYTYYFNHRTESLGDNTAIALGAPHRGELDYVFGEAIMGGFTDDEIRLSQAIIRAWTTFAAGTPVYHDLGYNDYPWPAYTEPDRNMLVFDTDALSTTGEALVQTRNKWSPVSQFWASVRNAVTHRSVPIMQSTEGTTVLSQQPSTTTTTERPNRQDTDPPVEAPQCSTTEKMETRYLKLSARDADVTIFVLLIAAFLLALIALGLLFILCRSK